MVSIRAKAISTDCQKLNILRFVKLSGETCSADCEMSYVSLTDNYLCFLFVQRIRQTDIALRREQWHVYERLFLTFSSTYCYLNVLYIYYIFFICVGKFSPNWTKETNLETFDVKSNIYPLQNNDLVEFQKEILNIVKNLKFTNEKREFS